MPDASLNSFPRSSSKARSSARRAIGDTGTSAPGAWIGGLAAPDVHALVFLFAQSDAIVEDATGRLRGLLTLGGGFDEISMQDGRALPGNLAHFGYRDGFAQPTIDGGLPPLVPDVLPPAPAGEFLFGYPSQYADFTYPVPEPADRLGINGSFVAFRVLEQDCAGFERFLADASRETALDAELIAAKLCGRWRNGVPLSLSPDTPNARAAARALQQLRLHANRGGARRVRRSPRRAVPDRRARPPHEPAPLDGRRQQRAQAAARPPRTALRPALRSRRHRTMASLAGCWASSSASA